MRSYILAPALVALVLASPVQKRDDISQDAELSVQASIKVAVGPPVARPAQSEVDNNDAAPDSVIVPDLDIANLTTPVDSIIPDHDDDEDEDDDDESAEDGDIEKRAESKKAKFYRTAALKRHNVHRKNHGAGPLTWSAPLAAAAMKSAQRCTFAHFMSEDGLSYGQNLALGYAAPNIAGIITDGWYSEVKYYSGNYGQAQPDYGTNMSKFSQWGHFTQVVWKDSTKVGCATWRCKSVKDGAGNPMSSAYGGDVTYCNYQGPGNYGGEYANNVGRPTKTQNIAPTAGVDQKSIAKAYSAKTGQKWTV